MYLVSPDVLDNLLLDCIDKIPFHNYDYKVLAKVMYNIGCRACETYSMSRWVMVTNDVFTLSPCKFSDTRVFSVSELPVEYVSYLLGLEANINNVTYRKLEYCLNSVIGHFGIYVKGKDSVCHLFRHNYVKKLIAQGLNEVQIKSKLGERTLRSTRQYMYSEIFSRHVISF
jgi:site-specific recombinase XerD